MRRIVDLSAVPSLVQVEIGLLKLDTARRMNNYSRIIAEHFIRNPKAPVSKG